MTQTKEDFLASLKVGMKLQEKDSHAEDFRYILELPENTDGEYHLTGNSDVCMCESWYEADDMFERFEVTEEIKEIREIDSELRECPCKAIDNPDSYVFGTVTMEREDLKEVLDILLDIAEDCYAGYSGSDNIAKCLDFYKANIDGEREPLTCSHYQCNGERVEGTDSCKNHQFCTCEKVQGKHYTINH